MTTGAQTRKTLGAVISGRCRDTQEVNSLGYPVFARGRSTLGQSTFTRASAVNVPLEIHSHSAEVSLPPVTVYPEDFIVADEDGVVCVPREDIQKVIEAARKGKEVDERCMKDIRAGKSVQASFEANRG